MAKIPVPTWLPALTNANWQKKKGNIAKITYETGIGQLIDEAHAAFHQIKWVDLQHEVDKFSKESGGSANARALNDSGVTLATNRLNTLERKVVEIGKQWEKNKLIPKSSVAAAAEIKSAVNHMILELEKVGRAVDTALKTVKYD